MAAEGDDKGVIIADAISDSSTILFTAKRTDVLDGILPGDTITMTIGGVPHSFSGRLHLLKGGARFIAEFSIVAKN